MDTAMAKSPGVDTAMVRNGYSDTSFLLHRILHQKVRNMENLRGKIRAFVLLKKKNEIKVSPPIRRKRTTSIAATEAVRERWETLEAQIEFPILKPRPIDAPEGPVEEEPQIEGLLF